jgi:SAM-dependent methyltransferase
MIRSFLTKFWSVAALLVLAWPALSAEAQPAVKLDVPYVPTPNAVLEAMMKMANVGPSDVVYDLGSGDGRIAITAVQKHGAKKAVGIDLNPTRTAEANVNARRAGVTDRTTFITGDIFDQDFSEATVVTMYLFDHVNLRLRPRIFSELHPGTRIVSHQFHMFDWTPDQQSVVFDNVPVYFWVVPARAEGRWTSKFEGEPVVLDLSQQFQFVSGTMRVGDQQANVARTRLVGMDIAFDTSGDVHFKGRVLPDAITGTLTRAGVARPIALERTQPGR